MGQRAARGRFTPRPKGSKRAASEARHGARRKQHSLLLHTDNGIRPRWSRVQLLGWLSSDAMCPLVREAEGRARAGPRRGTEGSSSCHLCANTAFCSDTCTALLLGTLISSEPFTAHSHSPRCHTEIPVLMNAHSKQRSSQNPVLGLTYDSRCLSMQYCIPIGLEMLQAVQWHQRLKAIPVCKRNSVGAQDQCGRGTAELHLLVRRTCR